MKRPLKKFQDWMTIITYAEADEADMGFRITSLNAPGMKGVAKEATEGVTLDSLQTEAEPGIQSPSLSPVPSVEPKLRKEKLEVLVVDDEPIVGRRLRPALTKYGYHVEIFANPVAAMERFDEKEFDIVVTDLRMEDLDGIGVLEHVVSKSEKTKVIFITGYATVENAREALVKGAFDFIAKPFKVNDLRMAITKAALSLGYRGAVAGAPA